MDERELNDIKWLKAVPNGNIFCVIFLAGFLCTLPYLGSQKLAENSYLYICSFSSSVVVHSLKDFFIICVSVDEGNVSLHSRGNKKVIYFVVISDLFDFFLNF